MESKIERINNTVSIAMQIISTRRADAMASAEHWAWQIHQSSKDQEAVILNRDTIKRYSDMVCEYETKGECYQFFMEILEAIKQEIDRCE